MSSGERNPWRDPRVSRKKYTPSASTAPGATMRRITALLFMALRSDSDANAVNAACVSFRGHIVGNSVFSHCDLHGCGEQRLQGVGQEVATVDGDGQLVGFGPVGDMEP